jgi:hypothetical protein
MMIGVVSNPKAPEPGGHPPKVPYMVLHLCRCCRRRHLGIRIRHRIRVAWKENG